MTATLLYNCLLFAADAAVLNRLRHKRTVTAAIALAALSGAVAVAAATLLAEDHFGILCFAAWAIFLHGIVLALGAAVIFWRTLRGWSVVAGIIAAALLAVAVDAFLIEPHWLEVSHVTIASPKVARPCRVVVLADYQVDRIGDYERQVIRVVADAKPDLILLAGDYTQPAPADWQRVRSDFHTLLQEANLAATARVFAVQGNCDSSGWEELFGGLGFTVAPATKSFELPDCLRLTCLSESDSFDPAARVPPDPERFQIVLGHCPNFALGDVPADLLIAGHTHGGQVQLPLIGPLMTLSKVPRRWASGMTQLPGGRRLLVARGTGMERGNAPRLRFFCRPELAVIDLQPSK